MKSTQVGIDGTVRCPTCGVTSFDSKRTGKAKLGGVLTVGVGAVVAPKRLKCQGCGTNLKRGSGSSPERRTAQGEANAAEIARLRAQGKANREARKERRVAKKAWVEERKAAGEPWFGGWLVGKTK